jgi:PAS domain S-box-containing protein
MAICIALVLVTTICTTISFYFILKNDKHRESRQRIHVAFDIVMHDLQQRIESRRLRFRDFLKENPKLHLLLNLYRQEPERMGERGFITAYLGRVGQRIKNFAGLVDLDFLGLYGADRELLIYYKRTSEADDLCAYVPSAGGKKTKLSINDERKLAARLINDPVIPYRPLPSDVSASYFGYIPQSLDTEYFKKNGRVGIRIVASIFRGGEMTGFVVGESLIDQQMVDEYVGLSQAEINFFAGQDFSVGSLSVQKSIDLNLTTCESDLPHNGSNPPERPVEIVRLGGHDYYQWQCALRSNDGSPVGGITFGFSRQYEQRAINNVFFIVFVVCLGIGALATFIAVLFSRKIAGPIRYVSKIIMSVARGDISSAVNNDRIKDTSMRLSQSGDKFNQCMVDPTNSFKHPDDEIEQLILAVCNMAQYLRQMADDAEHISRGEIRSTISHLSEKDVLGLAFQRMTDYLERFSRIAAKIASGDFSETIEIKSEKDVLGNAFLFMSNELSTTISKLRKEIQDRERAEYQLREREFQLRTFFNSNPEGILILGLDGGIQQVNKSLLKLTGYVEEDLLNKNYMEFLPAEDVMEISSAANFMSRGILLDNPIETRLTCRDGRQIHVRVRGWLIVDENSKAIALGAFIRDISHEKDLSQAKTELEKQLQQLQKTEAIGNLAGGIAHDFNNILAGILGYAELLQCTTDSLEKKGQLYVSRIIEAGERAKGLVQQILRFSRKERGLLAATPVSSIVKETVKLTQSTLPASIEVVSNLKDTHAHVYGDATQIHQVLMNLCTNAYHAMRELGGRLEIQMGLHWLDTEKRHLSMRIPPGQYVRISVADAGHGMSQETVSRIFDPYFTTKPQDEGTGLGLSVTLGIVKNHNGLIEVESRLGEGSRFDLWLPAIDPEDQHTFVKETPLPAGNNERILLVDDEAFFLDAMARHLDSLGYRTFACSRGGEAFSQFQGAEKPFDLIITDQNMPEMNGTDLIAAIRKIDKMVPVILCTGFSEVLTEQAAKPYSINKLLMKPVSRRELSFAVYDAMNPKDA